MNVKWKNAITIAFLLLGIVALYFILREYSIKEIIATYRHFDLLTVVLYACMLVIMMMALTWRWDVILKSRNIKIPFNKLFVYRIIGIAINFVTPGPRVGGEPTQATLMTKHGVEFTEGLSTIMIDKIIDTTTSGILFIIGVILVGLKYTFPKDTLWALLIGGAVFIVLIGLFYYRMLTNRHFFLKIFHILRLDRTKIKALRQLEASIERIELMMIEFYRHNSKAFIKTLAISVLTWALMFFEYSFATKLVGVHVGAAELFFIISFIGIAMLFPIPMAVGVLEAGQLSAFALIGLSGNAAVALAFLVRFKDIVWAIIGMILLATYGFHVTKVVKKKYKNKNANLDD